MRAVDYISKDEQSTELTAGEKQIRDSFVEEYMKDFSAVDACVRVGYNRAFAEHFSLLFLSETYTLRKIEEAKTAERTKSENKDIVEITKREVMTALRNEMNYRGPGSNQGARVAAAAKLASLLDMDPAKKIGLNIGRGGVMTVPGIASVEDWEQAALESQSKLRDDVRLN